LKRERNGFEGGRRFFFGFVLVPFVCRLFFFFFFFFLFFFFSSFRTAKVCAPPAIVLTFAEFFQSQQAGSRGPPPQTLHSVEVFPLGALGLCSLLGPPCPSGYLFSE